MKYSILVLGASISISLFIRLCCSLEANLEDELFSGRADEVAEKFLKFSLQSGAIKDKSYNERDNQLIEEWIKDMKAFRNEVPLHERPAAPFGANSRHGIGVKVDNEELCGDSKPPEIRISDCNGSEEDCACDPIAEIPQGCKYEYTNKGKTLGCNGEQITVLPPLPLQLSELGLTGTGIEKISGSDIRNVTINTIRLLHNQIDYIHPWAFHDVQNLANLIIAGNWIEYLAYELYVGLDNATYIDLQHNQISFKIYRECEPKPIDKIRKVLPKLRWLQFSGNPLHVIPSQMFAGLRESPVTALYLDNCYLEEIDEDAFSHLGNLLILNLSDNPSQIIYPIEKFTRILQPLTSLTNIYLANLGFSEFPMETLSQISHQLTVLDLSKNKFHTIRYETLSKFSSLRELYLDDSSIQVIEPNAFSDNTNLRSLSLKNNMIQQFPTYFPSSVTHLFVSNRQLLDSFSKTPAVSFHNLTSLTHLVVSGIKFDRITKDTFIGLSALTHVYITGCDVRSIEDGAFLELQSLKVLSLDNNVISGLSSETFIGLDNLTQLSLQNCSLSFDPISPSSTLQTSESTSTGAPSEDSPFKFLPKLQFLNMSNNDITFAPSYLFQNLSSLCYISLASNPITSWDARLLSTLPTTNFCHEVKSNDSNGCENVRTLDLSNGKVQFIKNAMLEDFRQMKQIDLTNIVIFCDELACQLRDEIIGEAENCTLNRTWINEGSYKCKDVQTGELFNITEVRDEICAKKRYEMPSLAPPSESGAPTTIIAVIVSLSLVVSIIIILAYKNRDHVRYFWFSFKFKVMPVGPRKAKISTMDDTSSSSSTYDYDVFISYHHDDSKFIEEIFLPEIEMQKDNRTYEEEIVEAKNLVYFIEKDEILKKSTNNNNNDKVINVKPNTPRFKVCLHERDFAAGVPITENIVDCVDRSRKTVIFVSRKYMESQWCSYELNLAYHRLVESRRKSFLLVLMEEVPTEFRTKVLTYLMVSKTYLQWPGAVGLEEEKKAFWKRLRYFLQSS